MRGSGGRGGMPKEKMRVTSIEQQPSQFPAHLRNWYFPLNFDLFKHPFPLFPWPDYDGTPSRWRNLRSLCFV